MELFFFWNYMCPILSLLVLNERYLNDEQIYTMIFLSSWAIKKILIDIFIQRKTWNQKKIDWRIAKLLAID